MATLWQDMRYALRMLGKSPMLTVIVVLTLALGVGANTAIFGIVNGLLLRPLPVKSPEQIVVLAGKLQGDTLGIFTLSYPQLVDFRQQGDAFSDVFASQIDLGGLSFGGKANQFLYCHVTGNYFSTLGVGAFGGRLFTEEDDKPASAPVADHRGSRPGAVAGDRGRGARPRCAVPRRSGGW